MVCAGTNSSITTIITPAEATTPESTSRRFHAMPPSIIITNITPASRMAVDRFSPNMSRHTTPVSIIIRQKVFIWLSSSSGLSLDSQ